MRAIVHIGVWDAIVRVTYDVLDGRRNIAKGQ